MLNEATSTLKERVLEELGRAPGRKASELASALGAERREVNRCLSYELVGLVQQGSDYRWRLVETGHPASPMPQGAATTEIAKLCRYYLECIGQDMDQGVSAFARNQYGDPDYAELSGLPATGTLADWYNAPGVGRVLGSVRQNRTKLVAWLGYPVRLRRHRTARWEGFFVEPLLLWRIELGERDGELPSVSEDAPLLNAKFLRSVAMGDGFQLAEEAARLTDELGLNVPLSEQPEVEDLVERLTRIRPDWDWREALDPIDCTGSLSLADMTQEGILNRAVVLPGERSPYTQGLETELKALSNVSVSQLPTTALGKWLAGSIEPGTLPTESEPLIEVLPMNTEQRAAVLSALTSHHTVVTGPPGTGKSQVVTNLLVNAAWRGMKVLFASKNNKAVDVVEARVNGLGNRPVLLRLGSREYQARLAGYLTQLLAGNPGAEDQTNYEESLERHRSLTNKLVELDRTLQKTLDARNTVDRLDAEADDARQLFDPLRAPLDEKFVQRAQQALRTLERATEAADREQQGLLTRLIWLLHATSRLRELNRTVANISPLGAAFGLKLPKEATALDLPALRNASQDWRNRLAAAQKLIIYRRALVILEASPSFEEIAQQRSALTEHIAQNSQRLWRDWVQLAPTRLSATQRKDVADYAAVLQLTAGPNAERVHASVRQRARTLQAKVTELFSGWAVTSLAARGRVPFEPGYFDLVVIDEASQCDIASALPLLYRARRSVIIGDSQQLRHISALGRPRDSELQHKHGLVETRLGWMYSVSSLYDVAASVVPLPNIINLRDHHRSHADIIEFSNRAFYEGRLRVATRYRHLKRPRNSDPGILWQDIRGKVVRPSSGGAQNHREALAVLAALEDLLINRKYEGTVGVVTPFRAQAQLLQKLVEESTSLQSVRAKSELLVDTVHSFQGDERDVMLFSPVVSEDTPAGALAFLRSNGNLFNVAITRARGLLHVVGDRSAAASSDVDYLANFAAYVAGLGQGIDVAGNATSNALGPTYPTVARPEQVSDWERLFYRALFAAGIRPIPQFSVEQYALDFAVIVGQRRLNIEVDGERYHRNWTGELCLRDQLRNQRLIELGWEVKRFWVYQIRDKLDESVASVSQWVKRAMAEA